MLTFTPTRKAVLTLTLLAAAASLTGCSALGASSASTPQPDAASSSAEAAAPSASSAPVGVQSPSASPAATTPAAGKPNSGSNTDSFRSGHCEASNLTGTIKAAGGGTAGGTDVTLVLTNTSSSPCTLQGWPGVSFVGHGNGTQIGAAARQDRTAGHPTVTIPAHQTGFVPLHYSVAANYPTATCKPVAADGFRVYPPASKTSLFVKAAGLTACSNASLDLLTVSAILPSK